MCDFGGLILTNVYEDMISDISGDSSLATSYFDFFSQMLYLPQSGP